MTDYLRWSLWQFYLLLFWPTRYGRETKDLGRKGGFLYLLKMLPWMVTLPVPGNLLLGYVCQGVGIDYQWVESWKGVAVGVAISVANGVWFGVLTGMSGYRAFGVACVVAFGVSCGGGVGLGMDGSAFGRAFGVVDGVVLGVVSSVLFGVAFDVGFEKEHTTIGVVTGVMFGVAAGVAGGVAFGVAGGVAFGVSFPLVFWITYFRLLTYPIDIALALVAYRLGRRHSHAAWNAWRCYPVAWNEVIWLPLPFASKLLALLVEQDREEGFRQIAFVAAERRLQRRVALAALVGVVIRELQERSITKLANVTGKLSWTTDIPAELPADLLTALPRFDRVAQHLGQYLVLHSPFRRAEALRSALSELASLQRSLITARGKTAPRLLRVANDWHRIITAEYETFRERVEQSREIPNPFIFGQPVVEQQTNVFTGRQDIVRQIEQSLLGTMQSPTLLLHGPRRVGKSSILNQLPRLLGPDFAPAFVDCQTPAVTGSTATLLRYLSQALSAGLQRRRVTIQPLTREALAKEPFDAFEEWLDQAEQAMPDGMRALLCLDEYESLQRALDAGWGEAFLDQLRHVLQHRRKLVLMFTGAHTFEEKGPAWTSRFISARRVRVSFLSRDDVIPLLTCPIPEFDLTYAPGALDVLLDATRGQPLLTQAVAFELVQFLNEQGRKQASPGDVEEAITRALASAAEYFANVWYDAGVEGQAILLALVRGQTPPNHPTARGWLLRHDVLKENDVLKAPTFAVPMVKRWIKQKADSLV